MANGNEITKEKLDLIFDTIQEGVVEQDSDGKIINWNQAALKILDITDAEISGKTHKDPKWNPIKTDGSHYPDEENPAILAITTGEAQIGKTMGLKYPKGTRWIQITAIPYKVENNKNHAIVTFVDITEIVEKNLSLDENNKKLEKVNKLMVSRELKMAELKEKLKDK